MHRDVIVTSHNDITMTSYNGVLNDSRDIQDGATQESGCTYFDFCCLFSTTESTK